MTKTTTKQDVIGCDLGDKKSELCVLDAAGAVTLRIAVRTTPEAMRAFFAARTPSTVVIEVGTHSRWVSELLKELKHRVIVANARRVKLISQNDSKRDKKDAELLARLGRADPELLAPLSHRSMNAQADLAVAKARDGLVRVRTKLVNQARGLVKSFGARLPKCSSESFHRKTMLSVPSPLRAALDPIYAVLEQLEKQIKTLDKTIERIAKKHPDVEILSQPSGVGTLTALVYLLTLEDKTRFKKSRLAGAFVGLRPKQDQSGDSDKQLRITKAGDGMLRRLLVLAANYILGPFGPDSDLRRWGQALAERGGKNAKKRATVAVARKLAVLMHRLWVTGEVYQPLGYGQKAVPASSA